MEVALESLYCDNLRKYFSSAVIFKAGQFFSDLSEQIYFIFDESDHESPISSCAMHHFSSRSKLLTGLDVAHIKWVSLDGDFTLGVFSLTAALLCFFLLFFLGFKVLDEPHSYVTPGTGGLLLLSRMVV